MLPILTFAYNLTAPAGGTIPNLSARAAFFDTWSIGKVPNLSALFRFFSSSDKAVHSAERFTPTADAGVAAAFAVDSVFGAASVVG